MNTKDPNYYLSNEIKKVDTELKDLDQAFRNKELISFIAFAVFALVSFSSLALSLPVFLSTASLASLLAIYKYKNAKKNDNIENRLNQEKLHLKKLEIKTPNVDKSVMEKRVNKILSINKLRTKAAKDYFLANDITLFTYAVTAIGGVLTFFNPACGWIPLVGIVSNIISGNNEIKKHKKCEILENRINNLSNDLDLIELITDEDGRLIYEVKDEFENTKDNKKSITKEKFEKEIEYIDNCLNDLEKSKTFKKVK